MYADNIKKHTEAPFFLKKVNALVGFGAYAKKNISYLSYVGEYAGEVRKRRRRTDKQNPYIFGYMVGYFGTPWVIDSKDKGNFTRFINHSFTPNVNSRGIVVDGIYHVIFFANRNIAAGEQLTYDYGPAYWVNKPYPQQI